MTLIQLLNLANRGYPDGFLGNYYDPKTGNSRDSSGDTLALFIVRELQETFDPAASDEAQTAEARRALHKARRDLNGVINGLAVHGAGGAKTGTVAQKPILVEFDYPDSGHFSETVEATEAQVAALRDILSRAEAVEAIRSEWYVGEPQKQPTAFEEFLERLRWALGSEVVGTE